MPDTIDPWGEDWDVYFDIHALPLEEEQAFRQYLAAHQVPAEASLQDLVAHHDQFVLEWEPGERPPREPS